MVSIWSAAILPISKCAEPHAVIITALGLARISGVLTNSQQEHSGEIFPTSQWRKTRYLCSAPMFSQDTTQDPL